MRSSIATVGEFLLPLNHADVIAVDADAYRKFFLRQAALLAQQA
jgi:hypothetical protein